METQAAQPAQQAPSVTPSAPARLLSLDVFRGATIAAMMLVNNPGDWSNVYSPLLHASWHGWTFTDLIFPFFIWIVGVAIPLSTARRLAQGQGRRELFLHAVRRAAILFGLGLFLNSFGYFIDGSLFRDGVAAWLHNYLTTVRIPGVLQRIALCYLAATAIYLTWTWRGQAAAIGALLVSYWALMMLVPVPGFGAGVLEKEGNLAQFIDNAVFNGPLIGTHLWRSTKTWDPEGLLSTLPAIATCLFGVLAGHVLRSSLSADRKTAWLFASGNLLMLAGLLLAPFFPINKNLWTPSYTLLMAGMATCGFALCYWFVDIHGWRKWAQPFAIYGMNAITVFVLAGVIGRLVVELEVPDRAGESIALKTFVYTNLLLPLAGSEGSPLLGALASPKNASLLYAICFVVLLYLVAWFMYRRKWFVRF